MPESINLKHVFNDPKYFVQILRMDHKSFEDNESAFSEEYVESLRKRGYVGYKDDFALRFGDEDSYVYLWKHIDGDVFYVGSGRGHRSKQIKKNNNFLSEIDNGDAVVYIVAYGIARYHAFLLESYVSGLMSLIGMQLSNKDGVIKTEKGKYDFMRKDWLVNSYLGENATKKTNEVVKRILNDKEFTYNDAKTTVRFLNKYGVNYFSQKYSF